MKSRFQAPCGRPAQHPLHFGEINYTPEQINELLAMIPLKAYRSEIGKLSVKPDEEDITATVEEKPVLKFKDRDTAKGKGYIILRTEKPLAEQMVQENTIYEIRYDFDLGGETLEVPANCVLKFNGGSLNNGKIAVSNNNKFVGYSTCTNLTIEGYDVCNVELNNLKINNGSILIGINSTITNNKNLIIDNVIIENKEDINNPVYLCDIENCTINNLKIYRINYSGYNFSVCRCKNLVLNDFVFEGAMRFAINIFIPLNGIFNENIKILNGVIKNTNNVDSMTSGDQGIYAHEFKNLTVENVNVSGFTYIDNSYDIKIRDGEDVFISNCRFGKMMIAGYNNNPEWSYNGLKNVRVADCNGYVNYYATLSYVTNSYIKNHIGDINDNSSSTRISGYIQGNINGGYVIKAHVFGDINSLQTTIVTRAFVADSVVTGCVYNYNGECNIKNSIVNQIYSEGTGSIHHTTILNTICSGILRVNLYGTRSPNVKIHNTSVGSVDLGGVAVNYNKVNWGGVITIAGDTFNVVPVSSSREYRMLGSTRFDSTTGKPIWYNGTEWVDAMGNQV